MKSKLFKVALNVWRWASMSAAIIFGTAQVGFGVMYAAPHSALVNIIAGAAVASCGVFYLRLWWEQTAPES